MNNPVLWLIYGIVAYGIAYTYTNYYNDDLGLSVVFISFMIGSIIGHLIGKLFGWY